MNANDFSRPKRAQFVQELHSEETDDEEVEGEGSESAGDLDAKTGTVVATK